MTFRCGYVSSAARPGHPAACELRVDHLNRRHWNTVVLDGSVPDQLLRDLIEDSYDLVVAGLPLAQRERLGWVALNRER
jgi:YjbR